MRGEDIKRKILRDDGKSEREIVYEGREKKAAIRGRDRKRDIVCVCVCVCVCTRRKSKSEKACATPNPAIFADPFYEALNQFGKPIRPGFHFTPKTQENNSAHLSK